MYIYDTGRSVVSYNARHSEQARQMMLKPPLVGMYKQYFVDFAVVVLLPFEVYPA